MKRDIHLTKNNYLTILTYLFIFFLFLINFAILDNFKGDNYFNYGFAYNIANSMIPYRDFNMILFPFSSFLTAFFMKIFGTKLIVYYAVYSLVGMMTIFIIRKIDKSLSLPILFFMLLFPVGGYNYLSLLLLFLIIYLEKNNKNDFLIGLILGVTIINNQKLALLLLPTLFTKDYKKILTRIKGVIIPLQIILIYIFINDALYYFLDYTVFGLFDFGNDNSGISIFILLELMIFIYLLYKYIKSKDKIILYCLCFQILAFPIVDMYHTSLGLIAFIFCTCSSRGKMLKFTNILFIILIVISLSSKFIKNNLKDIYLNKDTSSNYYLTVESITLDKINNIIMDYYYDNIENYDIYFNFFDMYYFKLKNGIQINKFDLVLNGNNGYNGNDKLKNQIKSMSNTLFVVYEVENKHVIFDQTNYELMEFITNNYEQISDLGYGFYVYKIEN